MNQQVQVATVDHFKITLDQQKGLIQQVLPKHLPVEKFVRAALIAVANSPGLLEADQTSLFNSLQRCASDGLIPDGREAALIEFNTKQNGGWIKKAQYMPMIDGVLKRARQTGEIATITARLVYTADQFDYWVDGDGEHLMHRPHFGGERGDMQLVYAMAKLKDGLVIVEPMTMADVERVRLSSKNPDRGPWREWYDRMALKSVLHRLARRLPNSSEIMEMLDQGNFMYGHQEKDVPREDAQSVRPALELYPQDRFDQMLPGFAEAIRSGRTDAESLIIKIGSRNTLTDEQKATIRGINQ